MIMTNGLFDVFAQRLKIARGRVGLTQGQVAAYEDTTQQYISQLEKGINRPPAIELLHQLAIRYRTSADYLLGLTNDPTPASRRELSPSTREMRDVFEDLTPWRQDELLALARAMLDNQRRQDHDPETESLLSLIETKHGPDARRRALEEMT